MKNLLSVFTVFFLLLCFSVSSVLAGGYQLNLLGQRQIGMGHTGTGLALDIASISMNPGGLSMVDQNAVLLGSSATFISTAYRAPAPSSYLARTDSDIRTPFSLYFSSDTPIPNLRAGIGVYTPYGNAIRWEEDWKYRLFLNEISLTAIFVQPTFSYNINDRLGIGAGLIYAYGAVNLQRDLPVTLEDGNSAMVELDGSTTAIGFNAGIYAQILPQLSLGVSYRSEIDMSVEGGDAIFEVPVALSGDFPQGNTFDSSLPLPAVLSLGIGLEATERLRFALDANYTFWSAYEQLEFIFDENTDLVQDIAEPRNYNDRLIFRLGTEVDALENLQLRLGGYFDPSPVDEGHITPETPDVDRYGITAGLGYAFTPQFGVNASLLLILSQPREQTEQSAVDAGTWGRVPVGEFHTRAWIPGLSLYYSF